MKKYSRICLLIALLFPVVIASGQQKLKIGHINSQELLAAMPESDSAQKRLEAITKEHEDLLDEMTVEFNKKLDAYRKATEAGTLSDLAKTTKEAELQDLQTRIQTFQQTAQEDLQQKRAELFTPVQDAALKAVNAVAEENGFTYIFDTGMGAVVYSSPDAIDILPLVKAKLGLK
jgi:outer membrane protein